MMNQRGLDPESRVRARAASPLCLLLLCLLATATAFPAESPVRILDLTIPSGPGPAQTRVLRVNKDDLVQVRVTSEAAGEIHLHAYRLEAKITPGAPAELNFRARSTGRFRIEWHPAGGTAKKGDHHGPPLATLEVRPK